MKEYKYAIIIGRFQPLHRGHYKLILGALNKAEHLILIVGSSNVSRSTKNPWTYTERKSMIAANFAEDTLKNITFVPGRDYHYNDNLWVSGIQAQVESIIDGEESVCLMGAYKDGTSYYVRLFPQWDFIPFKLHEDIDATNIRNQLLNGIESTSYQTKITTPVKNWLDNHFLSTIAHKNLCDEWSYIDAYKKDFSNVPFPITFTTVDAVVIKSGHILVIKRKINPGIGLIALPGGFIKTSETLKNGMLRELKEETHIKMNKSDLRNKIIDEKTFDYPTRSIRGRSITQAFCIDLGAGELPIVKGGDDAKHAFWLPLMEVPRRETEFFEDHAHIINYFVSKF